jgi:regulator of cell morphogenesis and NO signaling
MIDRNSTLGELVAQQPSCAAILEKLGLDYCCGGKRTVAAACAGRGLDADTLLRVLEAVRGVQPRTLAVDCSRMTLTELVDHIEATHHVFVREHLPWLAEAAGKVANVHGERHPELHRLRQIYCVLQDEISQHLAKEEQILFPMVRELDKADKLPSFHCGSIANPIRVMEEEHDRAGSALSRMRELTKDFTVPEDACSTYSALLEGLKELESDLHQHIHKENNILFPKAIEAEKRLGQESR